MAAATNSLIRGGVGSFAGRTPYVWLMNQYGNTGVDFTSLSATNNAANQIPFVANPNAQPSTIVGAINSSTGTQTINLIDPKYRYPQVLRGNVGYDRSLGFLGLVGTAEFVWSKRRFEDILYKDLKFMQEHVAAARTATRLRGRATPKVNNAVLLTNATKGNTKVSRSAKLREALQERFRVGGSYFYNRARSISDERRSPQLPIFTIVYTTYDLNNPTLARWELRSRPSRRT